MGDATLVEGMGGGVGGLGGKEGVGMADLETFEVSF
jgi:hypothetical protein